MNIFKVFVKTKKNQERSKEINQKPHKVKNIHEIKRKENYYPMKAKINSENEAMDMYVLLCIQHLPPSSEWYFLTHQLCLPWSNVFSVSEILESESTSVQDP